MSENVSGAAVYNVGEAIEGLAELLEVHPPQKVQLHFSKDPTVTELHELHNTIRHQKKERDISRVPTREVIKQDVEERKTVHAKNARVEFFQALFAFNEQCPLLRNTIEVIHIALDPESPLNDEQHEFVSGVLAEMISFLPGLRELTLQHFAGRRLFASLVTLRHKQTLKLANFEHNNFNESEVLYLLRILPANSRFKLVVTNNALKDEAALARYFPRFPQVIEVEVFSQREGRLNEALFREAMAKRPSNLHWTVPVS